MRRIINVTPMERNGKFDIDAVVEIDGKIQSVCLGQMDKQTDLYYDEVMAFATAQLETFKVK